MFEKRYYLIGKIRQNEPISKKSEKNLQYFLNYIEHLLILASAVTGYV